jgi:glyoxylase-like metal-dependent hydrolase (beta-lactamase superfamily II)
MLVRKSGLISRSVILINRGTQCNYIVGTSQGILIDSCFSFEVDKFLRRIEDVGVDPASLYGVALTHLHAERAAGIALLRTRYPHLKLMLNEKMSSQVTKPAFVESLINDDSAAANLEGTTGLLSTLGVQSLLKLFSPDIVFKDGDLVNVNKEAALRVISTPGHTDHSVAFAVQPDQVVITDESCGYFRVKGFTANGGDLSIAENLRTLKKLSSLEISALAMPNQGALTGNLIRRHLKTVEEYTHGMMAECQEAFSSQMAEEEILAGVRGAFYSDINADIALKTSIDRSLDKVWNQIKSGSSQQNESENKATN